MIVDSSVWAESDLVCKVFVTMLALKDADHIYRGTAFNLAQRAHKTELEVLDALKVLSSPDTKRVEPQAYQGRRIEAVPEGWLVLNGEKYRELVSLEMKRARHRRASLAYRERRKLGSGKPLPGEEAFMKAEANGAPQDVLDRLSEPAVGGQEGMVLGEAVHE